MRKFWKIFVLIAFLRCLSPNLASATAELKIFHFDGQEYNLRIEDKSERADVSFSRAVEYLKTSFEKHTFVIGEMKDCSTVIDMPVGTKSGNHSFGGICMINHNDSEFEFMICADIMVGHSAIKFGGMFSEERLAKFVALNCYGG